MQTRPHVLYLSVGQGCNKHYGTNVFSKTLFTPAVKWPMLFCGKVPSFYFTQIKIY